MLFCRKCALIPLLAILPIVAALAACNNVEEATQPTTTATSSGETPGHTVLPPCATPAPGAGTRAPVSTAAKAEYADPGHKYSVSYPEDWKPCFDPKPTEIGGGVEFIGRDGLAHARIYVYPNSAGLPLESWLHQNDPIFLDNDRTHAERSIAGRRALVNSVDTEGLPTAEAYIDNVSEIVFVRALDMEEFSKFVSGLMFAVQ
jgi:hypothetical protein